MFIVRTADFNEASSLSCQGFKLNQDDIEQRKSERFRVSPKRGGTEEKPPSFVKTGSKAHVRLTDSDVVWPLHMNHSRFRPDPELIAQLDESPARTLLTAEGLRAFTGKHNQARTLSDFMPRTDVLKGRQARSRLHEISNTSDIWVVKRPYDSAGRSVVKVPESTDVVQGWLEDRPDEPLVFQRYHSAADDGDWRVPVIGNDIIGGYQRCNPGHFLNNIHAGGSVVKQSIPDSVRSVAESVRSALQQHGAYAAGLDLLRTSDRAYLLEVNAMSFGGLYTLKNQGLAPDAGIKAAQAIISWADL